MLVYMMLEGKVTEGDPESDVVDLAAMRSAILKNPTKFQSACPTCGNTHAWSISFFEDDSSVVALSILDKQGWETKAHGAVISVVCEACGYLNLYDRKKFFKHVKKWLPNAP